MSERLRTDTENDLNNVLARRRIGPTPQHGGSDGGGTMEDVIRRVGALERGQELIIGKLDGIAKGIADGRLENEKRFGAIESRLTGIEAKLDTKASGEALAKVGGDLGGRLQGVEGRVASIPTTWQTVGIIAALLFGVASVSLAAAKIWPASAPSQPAVSAKP